MNTMNPDGDWSDLVASLFFLGVFLAPPAAALVAVAWIARRLTR